MSPIFSYQIDENSLDIKILYGNKVVDQIYHNLTSLDDIIDWAEKYINKKNNQNPHGII